MKDRSFMPADPKQDPRMAMMHMKDDQWHLARHPLYLIGDAETFKVHFGTAAQNEIGRRFAAKMLEMTK